LPFFYQLGTQLHPLTELEAETSNRIHILRFCYPAWKSIENLLDRFSALTVCRADGKELIDAIMEIDKWLADTPTEKWLEEDRSVDFMFEKMIDQAKEFETVLSAELETLATYHVTQKGIYDTTALIERAENVLPIPMLNKIDEKVIKEIRESGKCLAFDCATASGFHIMRATELVMHKYYIHVCNPKSKKRLANWGAYIERLKAVGDSKVDEVVSILQQIKDRHRNLIMHPEIVLTPNEAFTLFEIAQSVIITMASVLPMPNKSKKKS
jgi:hypothetical protein